MSSQPRSVPEVKICGVTNVADARLAIELGATYIGLNFYPPSPRAVDAEQARRVRDAVADDARVVGVFVNSEASEVVELADRVGLDLLQFHGDEPIAQLRSFAPRAIRAFRAGEEFDPTALHEYHDFWGVLFDAPHEQLYGGTGRSWDYAEIRARSLGRRVFVAGGITADNVGSVLEALPGVFAVDVCSGVERAPGMKDERLMRRLFREIEGYLERRDAEHSS